MKEAEILESLIPSITANLEHRHSYVRKNAVLTVFTIYENHKELIPDAPELIDNFLRLESNPTAKRNAFLLLNHCDQVAFIILFFSHCLHKARALTYLDGVLGAIALTDESFQIVVFFDLKFIVE
jgi:coatomer subunit beta